MMMSASFSDDRRYRYALKRIWNDERRRFVVIGVNPSTADEETDDATIRRCISFAQREKMTGGLVMLNLFAFRSRDPAVLKEHYSKPENFSNNRWNDWHVIDNIEKNDIVVAAWGCHGNLYARDQAMRNLLHEHRIKVKTFGLTKDGHPKHPLYLPNNARLWEWPYDRR